jgi:hypothetical protein
MRGVISASFCTSKQTLFCHEPAVNNVSFKGFKINDLVPKKECLRRVPDRDWITLRG